jgi:hypothetical protein
MKYGLAYFRPDDAGGDADVDHAAADQSGEQLPEGLVKFLKSNNLAVVGDDPAAKAVMVALWRQSGKNAGDAEKQRKRAQEAEARLNSVSLDSIMGSLDDESKQKFSGLIETAQAAGKMDTSLKLLAEAGVTLTPELYDLAKAGPEATKAFLAVQQKSNGAQQQSAPDTSDMDIKIAQHIAKFLGLAADQQQKTQDQQQPKPDPLARYRKTPTDDDAILQKMKADADAKVTRR